MSDAQGVGSPPQGGQVGEPSAGGVGAAAGLATGAGPDEKERLWGMLAHLSAILFPVLGPLLVMLLPEQLVGHPSDFVKHHGKQALIFTVIAWIAVSVLGSVTCGIGFILAIAPLIFNILGGLAANKGEWYTYPGLKGFSDHK